MEISKKLQLVEPRLIPKGQDCSGEDLVDLFKLGLLLEAICTQHKGIGLSAVQVGLPLDFFIINFNSQYRYFLNCKYESLNGVKEKSLEACLSLKNLTGDLRYFEVERYSNVCVKGKELVVDPVLALVDFDSTPDETVKIVFQHEIDHSSQILISQIGKEVFLWENKD